VIVGSRPEIDRPSDVIRLLFDFTRGSPSRERGIYRKFRSRKLLGEGRADTVILPPLLLGPYFSLLNKKN